MVLEKPLRSYRLNLVHQYALSPDGGLIAASKGSTIYVWNTAPGSADSLIRQESSYRTLKLKDGAIVSAMAFSPDARQLFVSLLSEKSIEVWDVASAKMVRTLDGEGYGPFVINSDGTILASGSGVGKIKLWNVSTLTELTTLAGHELRGTFSSNAVNALSFSPDGKMLASGSEGKTIKIWDAQTGKELKMLTGHTAGVTSIEFDASGERLLSSSKDGTVRLWSVRSGELLLTLIATGKDWLVVTPDGLFDGTPNAWKRLIWRFDNNTFTYAPVEAFYREFYRPGLLQDIFAGRKVERPTQDLSKIDIRQPQVLINLSGAQQTASTTALSADKRSVTLTVSIADNRIAPRQANFPPMSGARDVRLFRNGLLVKVWRGDVLKGQDKVTLATAVPIAAGENRFTAYAFNHDNVKSADATVTVTGADSLARKGTAYILAVGVNRYANSQYNLKYAVADAQDFAAVVKEQQEKIGRYGQVEVITLLDEEATKANILKAIAQIGAKAQPKDAVLIYFAGHGTAQQKRFYLIPHDLGYAGDRTALDRAGLETVLAHSISDRELEAAVEELDAGQMILIIDACNSGQALEAEEKRRGPMNSAGLAQLAYEKGMYILTASQGFQVAQEAQRLFHLIESFT